MLMMLGVRLEMDRYVERELPGGRTSVFYQRKIVYDRKNLHIMIRVVTLPRCLTRRCAGFCTQNPVSYTESTQKGRCDHN